MNAVSDLGISRRPATLQWFLILAGLLALYLPTFYGLATTIWQEDDYAHGPVILAVVAWLIWDRRHALSATPSSAAPVGGIALLSFGLLTYVLGRSQGISVLEIGALIPILAGVLLAMQGKPALHSFWFMLIFIIYLVPLPGVFVDGITGPLKRHISAIAEQLLYSAGYPIARSGVTLTIGQYQLLVADACSGINSMFSLSAVGLLYLYLVQRKSLLHNGIVVASLLPVAFCANIARVIFLVLVTYHFGDEAGQGFIHKFSGMVLFTISLTLILLLDTIMTRLTMVKSTATT